MTSADYRSMIVRGIRAARATPRDNLQHQPRNTVQHRLDAFIGALEAGLEMAGDIELLTELQALTAVPQDPQ
jgi:hypothetical protein